MIENIIIGVSALLTIENVIFMIIGTTFGILVGAIPGLTGTMAVSLLIPITYVLDPLTGLSMLAGIYNGAIYGGSISAILFRIPGTPAACATIFDGYEMTKQGKAERALELAVSSSAFGGIFSVIVLILVAPLLAKVALMFGPAEYFWVSIFGIGIIVSLSTGSLIKGVLSGLIGLFLSQIGLDPATAFPRFTFGRVELLSGLELIPVLIGLFALPEAFALLEKPSKKENANIVNRQEKVGLFDYFPKTWRTYLRGSIIGTIVGIIPAAGGNIASFISYDQAKRRSKNPDNFGKGDPEGLIASESANNAITGGSFVPLLTLGIPGSTTTAAIMGAFLIHGINLGPQLFTKNSELVYGLMIALFLTNILMLFIGFYGAKIFRKVLIVPDVILAPLIISFSIIGSYAIRSNIFDVIVLLIFGILGYFMTKFDYPLAPLVLGLILGPMAEANLLRTLTISHGSILGLFNSKLSLLIFALVVVSIGGAIKSRLKFSGNKVS